MAAPQGPITVHLRRGAASAATDLLVLPVPEGQQTPALAGIDRGLARPLRQRVAAADFRGRTEDVLVHHAGGTRAVALMGLGRHPTDGDGWRRLGARARREADRQGARRVAIHLGAAAADTAVVATVAEAFLLAGYRFDRYKSERNERRRVERLLLLGDPVPAAAAARAALATVDTVVPHVMRVRDLVNEPASVATPRYLAAQAEELGRAIPGLDVEVWGVKRMQRENLAGLLAVARGSREEPRFLKLHYAGAGARARVALVGKAITFDSGGLSLKPAKAMETMKYDMAGGATVIGAVAAAAQLALPVEVTGYVPATENLPGGSAQKPGDVIRYANGKTVEVLNTDAEGRLVLADALALASRARPDAIIDLATLTGAVRVALGGLYAGVLGNDQGLVDALLVAGRAAGEPLWQLPLVAEYRDDLKSPIADLRNVGGGDAGTIIGALFLAEFVDGVRWAHLDIAGPAFSDRDLAHAPRGGTGFGVRLLVRYFQGL